MIIFDSTAAPVKPAPDSFGAGIAPARKARTFEPSAADRSWWAQESERQENARFDRMAEESAATDRHERGVILA